MFVRKGVVETRTCTEVKRQQATSREKLVRIVIGRLLVGTCLRRLVMFNSPAPTIQELSYQLRCVRSPALVASRNMHQQCIFIDVCDRNQLVIGRFTVDIPAG